MSDKPSTAHYAVKNTAPGTRFVTSAETGRPVSIEPNATVNVELTEAEAKSAKRRGDLELTKAKGSGKAETQTKVQAPNDGQPGDGGSADGREQTGNEGGDDDNGGDGEKPAAAYVAHEGLGKWFAYDAEDNKVAVDGADEPKAMNKEQASTWASDNKVEFRGSK